MGCELVILIIYMSNCLCLHIPGVACHVITHFSCSFTGYVLCEQFHSEFLSEELEYDHGSLNITQTDKAAFIL